MIGVCPKPDGEFDVSRFTNAHQRKRNEFLCYRATLDELLADDVMEPVLRTAGYEPDEFREMMMEMAWNLVTPIIGATAMAVGNRMTAEKRRSEEALATALYEASDPNGVPRLGRRESCVSRRFSVPRTKYWK
jgi:hypothetical protein